MKKKIIVSLICILFLISGCGKESSNIDSNFKDDVILNHLNIEGVYLSEMNTINDILNKFNNSEILQVIVCYSDEETEGCPVHSYEEFLSDSVSKIDITTLTFEMFIPLTDNQLVLEFSTYYKVFEEKGNNSQYFNLVFLPSNGTIKLDNAYLELLPMDDIKKDYTLASRSTDYIYYIDFESKTGDKYYLSGYPNSPQIEIFNTSERDRNL